MNPHCLLTQHTTLDQNDLPLLQTTCFHVLRKSAHVQEDLASHRQTNMKSKNRITKKQHIKMKKLKKHSIPNQQSLDQMCCAKCKEPLAKVGQVRLQPRSKLSVHMQKLLRKRRDNSDETETSLTNRQRQLLRCSMQCPNVLVMRCIPCKWKKAVQLNSRQAIHNQKAQLKQKMEAEKQVTDAVSEKGLEKQQLKRKKKKERQKRAAAAAKDEGLQLMKRPVLDSPLPRRTNKSPAQQTIVTPGFRKRDKQQLKNVLNAKKKENLSAAQSLSLFLDSLQ